MTFVGSALQKNIVSAVLMALMKNEPFRHIAGETGHSPVALIRCNRFTGKDLNTGTSVYEVCAADLVKLCFKLHLY